MADKDEVPWPKLRRIFPSLPQRQYKPSKAIHELYSGPRENTPEIPWDVKELTEKDTSSSKNSCSVENSNIGSIPPEKKSTSSTLEEKNSLPSTKIFEAINDSFDNPSTTKEKLSPEMLFDTNPDSNKSKNRESTTVQNKTSDKKLIKDAKKLGALENVSDDSDDEIQILEIVDSDSSTNSKISITEPVNLDGDDGEEIDLVVEAGKRKQSLRFLNIVSETGIRMIPPGGFKNLSNSGEANKDKLERRLDENLHKDNKDKSLRRKESTEATNESKIEKKRRKSTSSEESASVRFSTNKESNAIKISAESNIPRNETNNARTEENDANLNRQPSPTTISNLNESSRDKEELQATTADKTVGTPEEKAKENNKNLCSTTSGSESPTTDKDNTLNNECSKSSVDSAELSVVGNENEKEMLTVEKSFVDPTNPETNLSETITFYQSNDQAADNQLDETIIEKSKSQEYLNDNGFINQVTEPARKNGQLYSILETTAVLRSLIETEVKSLMKSALVENILKKIVDDFLTNHLMRVDNLISGLSKEQHQNVEQIQMEKQISRNNATTANQANSPNLNPMEEINSENNLCPTQISPQDLSQNHMPQSQQQQRSVPLVLPPAPPPTQFQVSQTVPLCSCRNPTCVRNENRAQMIAPNGNSSSLAHQYPTISQQLNNCSSDGGRFYNGIPCPIVNNSHTVQMEQFVNNYCPYNTPPSTKSAPRPPKRRYNKKPADNATIPAKVAKRGPKNSKNARSPNQRRHSSSSEQGMTLKHTINSFHDVVGYYPSYNPQTANNSYSMHLQEQRHNLNYNNVSLDPRLQIPQGLPPPSLHPPQMDSQYYNMQNQLRGQISGGSSPAMDFDVTGLRTPPANISQNRIQSVSPQDNNEPHYQQSSIPSSSHPVAATYEHYQQESDLVYPIPSANTLIFKSPAEHQKFLAQQAHNQSNVQIESSGYFHQNYLVEKRI